MTIQDFLRLLRSRWLIICVTDGRRRCGSRRVHVPNDSALPGLDEALRVHRGRPRFANRHIQGSQFSQERVISYTELLMGETLAKRTIDKLGLNMSPKELQGKVKATAKTDTVLIDVSVRDPVARQGSRHCRRIVRRVRRDGTRIGNSGGRVRPDARVVVEQRASIPERTGVSETRSKHCHRPCSRRAVGNWSCVSPRSARQHRQGPTDS